MKNLSEKSLNALMAVHETWYHAVPEDEMRQKLSALVEALQADGGKGEVKGAYSDELETYKRFIKHRGAEDAFQEFKKGK